MFWLNLFDLDTDLHFTKYSGNQTSLVMEVKGRKKN